MYVPAHFDASDLGFCHDARPRLSVRVDHHVSRTRRAIRVAPAVPARRAARASSGTLIAHVARAHAAARRRSCRRRRRRRSSSSPARTATSRRPGTTCSPAVPTWNYVAVHAHARAPARRGRGHTSRVPRAARGPRDDLALALRRRCPPTTSTKMMRGIVAFEIEIDRLEGKAKLSQNRSDERCRKRDRCELETSSWLP